MERLLKEQNITKLYKQYNKQRYNKKRNKQLKRQKSKLEKFGEIKRKM